MPAGAGAAASGGASADPSDAAAADAGAALADAGPATAECEGSFRQCLASRPIGMHDGLLKVADIDGDGRADALVLRNGSAVWIAIGGEETPVSHELTFAPTSGKALEFVFADVTGDGAADQVSAILNDCGDCPDYVTLSVAQGDGRGGFADPEVVSFCSFQLELRVFDLDGDASPELVADTGCPNSEAVLTVFDASPLAQRTTLGRSLDVPTGGDVDGDGIIDLAAVEQGNPPQLVVRPGMGGFAFGTGWRQPLPEAFAVDLQPIDLDGDAFADLLVLLQEGQRSVIATFQGSADGPQIVAVGPEALPFVALGSLASELIVADVDGDCRQEALLFMPDAPTQGARIVQFEPLSGEVRPLVLPNPLDLVQVAGRHAAQFPTLFGATADGVVELVPSTCGPPNEG